MQKRLKGKNKIVYQNAGNGGGRPLVHLDLFSGIGGFALAASWVWGARHKIKAFVEIDPFCQKVLRRHWPTIKIHDDIRTFRHDGTKIDILTGGFPCQPFSRCGKRRGTKDNRALWPEMFRVIKESRPTWVVGENVVDFSKMALDASLFDLESIGYTVASFVIPACAVDSPQKRERVFFLGHAESKRRKSGVAEYGIFQAPEAESCGGFAGNGGTPTRWDDAARISWPIEPELVRVADGVPDRVDRIRGLGNAVVPQLSAEILLAIKKQGI